MVDFSRVSEEFPVAFGRYQLNERLAMGGMAELFKAQVSGAHGFQKQVVIKRILPHLAADDHYNRMFIDEAKITARLSHPKIAQTLELGKFNGQLYIAMEFVDGLDLLAILRESAHRRTRVPQHLTVYMIQEMLDGLDFAHQQTDADGDPLNIVHRDISPSNVLVSLRGDVKLVDFGIAQATEREQETKAGTLKGKYGYMSPEQVVGAEIDSRSDLFSTGVVLTEMLMGRRLFTAANDLDVLLMVRDVDLSRFERYGGFLDDSVRQIVLRSLQKDPEDRFQTAGEFREALAEWLFEQRQRVSSKDVASLVNELYSDAWERRRKKAEEEALAAPPAAPGAAAAPAAPAAPAESPVEPAAAGESSVPVSLSGIPAGAGDPGESMPLVVVQDDELDLTSEEVELVEEDILTPQASGSDAEVAEVAEDLGAALDAAFADIASTPSAPAVPAAPAPAAAAAAAAASSGNLPAFDLGQVNAPGRRGVLRATTRRGEEDVEVSLSDGSTLPVSIDDLSVSAPGPSGHIEAQPLTSEIAFDDIASAVRGSGPTELPKPSTDELETARGRMPTTLSEIEETPDDHGNLAETSPIKVLARLSGSRASGLLTVTIGGIRKEIFFTDGRPEYVSSNVAGELFGEYLVSEKVVSDGELSMALAMMPHYGGKLGDTLVGLGLIKPLDVFRHLTRQVREKLIDVCTWTKGEFAWFDGRENEREAFPLDLDCYDAMGAGAMKLRETYVRDWADARRDVHLSSVKSRELRPESFRLGAEVRAIYNKLDGRKSLGELARAYDSDEHLLRFLRIAYLLYETSLARES